MPRPRARAAAGPQPNPIATQPTPARRLARAPAYEFACARQNTAQNRNKHAAPLRGGAGPRVELGGSGRGSGGRERRRRRKRHRKRRRGARREPRSSVDSLQRGDKVGSTGLRRRPPRRAAALRRAVEAGPRGAPGCAAAAPGEARRGRGGPARRRSVAVTAPRRGGHGRLTAPGDGDCENWERATRRWQSVTACLELGWSRGRCRVLRARS